MSKEAASPARAGRVLLLLALLYVPGVSAGPSSGDEIEIDGIRALLDEGRSGEAEAAARALAVALQSAGAGGSAEEAIALELAFDSMRLQGLAVSREAAAMVERALEIRQKSAPLDELAVARSLARLSFVHSEIDLDLRRALDVSGRALEMAEARLGSDDARLVPYLTERGRVLVDAGRYERAGDTLRRAIELCGATCPPRERARALRHLARLDFQTTSYADALSGYAEAARLMEQALGPENPQVASALRGQAHVLAVLGRYEESTPLAERCLLLAQNAYGREHPLVAKCLFDLALVERDRGTPTAARRLYEESIAILERVWGPRHPFLAGPLHQLAWLLITTWELDEARPTYERGIEIMEGYFGERDQRIAWYLNGYGNLLREMGDYAAAMRAFERANELIDESAEPNRLLRTFGDVNLAVLLEAMGELEESLAMFEEFMPALDRELEEDDPLRAELLQDYGWLLSKLGRLDEALELMARAVRIRERAFGRDHYSVAESLVAHAELLDRAGDALRATEIRRRALAIREQAFGAGSAQVGMLLGVIARERLSRGDADTAFQTALRAESIRRRSLRFTVAALPGRQALVLVRSWPGELDVLIALALREEDPSGPMLRDTWDALVRSRAISLDELAVRHRMFHGEGLEPSLMDALAEARERLASVIVRSSGSDYRETFELALRDKERLEADLASRSADFRRMQRIVGIGLDRVEQALPERSALVAFVQHGMPTAGHPPGAAGANAPQRPTPDGAAAASRAYTAFVLPPDGGAPRAVHLGPAEAIDGKIARWREKVSRRPPPVRRAAGAAMDDYVAAGVELRAAVWDPVAGELEGARQVFVVPDGNLNLVSFATLPDGPDRFLVESGPEIHYLSSERDLVQGSAGETLPGLLAVGAPDFDAPPRAPRPVSLLASRAKDGTPDHEQTGPVYRGETPACSRFHQLRFAALPGTSREVREISEIWSEGYPGEDGAPERQVQQLTGIFAHESWLKALAGRHGTLHLATHGFLLDDACVPGGAGGDPPLSGSLVNPLLRSGLALAAANNRAEAESHEDDGILTAEEVGSLDLSGVQWVVLSGCDTGAGQVVAGEGVLGLRRAFHIAGARSLIMSLWPVDDEATRRWMRELYAARMKGSSTSGAMRRAAVGFLEQNRKQELTLHPYFWGAFVAAGDWR